MKKVIKTLSVLVLAFILFLVLGACGPFMAYPEITDPSPMQAAATRMREDLQSPDRAMILETNTAALDERIRLINQAQDEIIVCSYDIRDGESTRDILALLCKKADEGVNIRILTDGVSALVHMNSDLFKVLAAHPNIEIRAYNVPGLSEPWKFMGRMHDKYLIVDDLAYILGGRNMFDYFIGDYPTEHRSHDREALIYNTAFNTPASGESSLSALRAYFEDLWNMDEVTPLHESGSVPSDVSGRTIEMLKSRYQAVLSQKPELFLSADYTLMTEPTRGVHLISNPTGLYAKEPVVFQTLYELMKLARNEVIIHSPYAVLNGYMQSALTDIAGNVPLTLMVNAKENGDNIVASSDYTYHRKDILETGANLLEYAGGESYHGKSIAIDDDISIIGSFNLDLRSAYVDTELMLVINSEEINRQLRENMASLHEDCVEIHTADAPAVLDAPFWKKAVWHVLGIVLQPFRILV